MNTVLALGIALPFICRPLFSGYRLADYALSKISPSRMRYLMWGTLCATILVGTWYWRAFGYTEQFHDFAIRSSVYFYVDISTPPPGRSIPDNQNYQAYLFVLWVHACVKTALMMIHTNLLPVGPRIFWTFSLVVFLLAFQRLRQRN